MFDRYLRGGLMTDISKCTGDNCKLKDTCYRYLAEPSEYQAFGVFAPSSDTQCEWYWRCEPDTLSILNRMWRD